MTNLEKLVKFAREKRAVDFKTTLGEELFDRIGIVLSEMKESVAEEMFAESDFEVYTFSNSEWSNMPDAEKSEYEDFDIDGEYESENGGVIWVVGESEYDVLDDVLDDVEEGAKYKGRSRRQVHMTQIKKRRMKGRNRQKKLKVNIKRRKSGNKMKIKRNRLKITRRFGGGDASGKSGKIGAARKRRGGRNITHKG
jgi:IMP dehydrogenase/GMP reductase